jgi:hypothetical protein
MPRSLASRRPVTSLSYSAMLFVAGNSNWTAYFKISPSGGMSTTPALFLWECRIRRSISPNDYVACRCLTNLSRSTLQWSLRVIETWSPVMGWIQHHITRSPLPIVQSTMLFLCFVGRETMADRRWSGQYAPRSSASASWSSWGLRKAVLYLWVPCLSILKDFTDKK